MPDDELPTTHLRTAWHPILIMLLQYLLPAERWRVVAEYLLSREPRRIDAVVIRRADPGALVSDDWRPEYLRSVLDDLRPYNVVHFKGATDELERADALQVASYVTQLMAHEDLEDPQLVALRVVAPRLSHRFAVQVRKLGGSLEETAVRGVHEGTLFGFALRVVEASVVWPNPREHLLYPLTPEYLARPRRLGAFDDKEGALYYHLVQNIKKLANDPTWKATMKDALLVESAARESLRELLTWLTPEQRLEGLAPEQRLAGLAPEQRLAGLAPDHAVLVLPDDALRALAPTYLATLPDDVQAAVRARLAR